MLRNGLYIIATPIGNLQDISARAIEILRQVDVVACEDTRVSKKLFSLLGIGLQKKFITYEDHSEDKQAQKLIDIINENKSVALISDAGSPLISDPGYKLVRKCREQDVYVTAVPGACAVITALQLSGLPTNRFMFAGFVPNKEKARKDLFCELKDIDTTLVFYETTPRLLKTLGVMSEVFAKREIAAAREITKLYEEVVNGDAETVMAHFEENEPRGEFVLMVAPPQAKNESAENLRQILAERLKTTSLKTAVKEVCSEFNISKNEVYALALELKDEK